ncbi:AMP-binding protein [Flammeovirgaceae bacterium SG7u.111]|nr:AMP-binding protein [Flammeovirgaceae bacterium SG7u.132]WPO36171.1 AMP-binding protein [Flammeovirgaceae bacterium SG7u.111]
MRTHTSLEKQTEQEIARFQNEALGEQIQYVLEHSAFYQHLFKTNNLDPKSIRTTEDLKKIPFTQKDDLQEFHDEFICASPRQIVDYSTTSGTQGKPVVIPQTEGDLQRLAYNEMRSLVCTGGTPDDIYQLTTTMNKQFMAGLAYFLGVRELGAGIIRVGSGAIPLQWQNIMSLKPTALIVVPSFLVRMVDYAKANGIDYKNSAVKKAICIGEPLRNSQLDLNILGKRIKEEWDIELFSTYASTEMATAFTECEAGQGAHLQPDLIVAEVVDEEGNEVGNGEAGELVITPLGLEAFPLLRFKTGDICIKYTDKCSCGRNTLRLGPIVGRKNQMIKFKGTTIYPPAIFDILDGFSWLSLYQVQLLADEVGNDKIVLNINLSEENKIQELKEQLAALLRVTPEIVQLQPSELNKLIFKESLRKPIKFADLR